MQNKIRYKWCMSASVNNSVCDLFDWFMNSLSPPNLYIKHSYSVFYVATYIEEAWSLITDRSLMG